MPKATKKTPGKKKKKPARRSGPEATGNAAPSRRAFAEESLDQQKKRAARILSGLRKLYPDADCALTHTNALQLLVATILSAQSTDDTVNKVAPILFAGYPTAEALANADPGDVEKLVYQTGFFRQKTRSIIGACKMIVERFGGQVPATMNELVQLPGVARKTANVLLGTWFGKNEGFVVDTHVGRLAHRLGLTWTSKDEKDAVKIEQDLCQVFPRDHWTFAGHALIWHGRRVCSARKPNCVDCKLNAQCPSAFTFDK
ncbi:MAG TPA: endonuclease III [Phycisphaerae bacterium]|nr:endonuclease III [Phycisphaerae bacterium]